MSSSAATQIESTLSRAPIAVIIVLVIMLVIVLRALCIQSCNAPATRRSGFDYPDNDFPTMENRGLDKESLDALPTAEYKSQNMNESLECVVCLSPFEENEKIRVLPNCCHSFHTECINTWLQSHTSCPICRQRVSSSRSPTIMCSNRGREATSSNIDGESVSVVRLHLIRGQRSSSTVQLSSRVSVLMLVNQALNRQGMYAGIPRALHNDIEIGPLP